MEKVKTNYGWYSVDGSTVTAKIDLATEKWADMESVAAELAKDGLLPDWDRCESTIRLPYDFELLKEVEGGYETVVTGEWKEEGEGYVIVEFEKE